MKGQQEKEAEKRAKEEKKAAVARALEQKEMREKLVSSNSDKDLIVAALAALDTSIRSQPFGDDANAAQLNAYLIGVKAMAQKVSVLEFKD